MLFKHHSTPYSGIVISVLAKHFKFFEENVVFSLHTSENEVRWPPRTFHHATSKFKTRNR
jgi:hypothetical protein